MGSEQSRQRAKQFFKQILYTAFGLVAESVGALVDAIKLKFPLATLMITGDKIDIVGQSEDGSEVVLATDTIKKVMGYLEKPDSDPGYRSVREQMMDVMEMEDTEPEEFSADSILAAYGPHRTDHLAGE